MHPIMTHRLARARMEELGRRARSSGPDRGRRSGSWRRLVLLVSRAPASPAPRRAA